MSIILKLSSEVANESYIIIEIIALLFTFTKASRKKFVHNYFNVRVESGFVGGLSAGISR